MIYPPAWFWPGTGGSKSRHVSYISQMGRIEDADCLTAHHYEWKWESRPSMICTSIDQVYSICEDTRDLNAYSQSFETRADIIYRSAIDNIDCMVDTMSSRSSKTNPKMRENAEFGVLESDQVRLVTFAPANNSALASKR